MTDHRLELLHRGTLSGEALVVVKGYLSQADASGDLVRQVRDAGWRGAIYRFHWDSSHVNSLLAKYILPAVGASSYGALPIGPAALVAAVTHWDLARRAAKSAGGDHLSKLVDTLPETRVSLLGHSLGARVVFHALLARSAQPSRSKHVIVKNAVLAGAAVRRNRGNWDCVAAAVEGRIVNIFNENDKVLKYLFGIAKLKAGSACGRKPIEFWSPKISNFCVTDEFARAGLKGFLDSHQGHWPLLVRTIGPHWR